MYSTSSYGRAIAPLASAMVFLATITLGTGCGNDGTDDLPPPLCAVETHEYADEGQFHAPEGTGLSFGTNPPNSGTHFPVWGRWGEHQEVLERGYYVHNMEHGGVVLLYNCSGPCPDVKSALEEILNSQPADSSCFSNVKNRMIMTADPLLDIQVAAASWRNTYRAPCVDPPSLKKFITTHYAKGPEDTCAEGSVPL